MRAPTAALFALALLAPLALPISSASPLLPLTNGVVEGPGWVSFKLTLPAVYNLSWEADMGLLGQRESDGTDMMDGLNRSLLYTFGYDEGEPVEHVDASSTSSPLSVFTDRVDLPFGLASITTITCSACIPGTYRFAGWVAGDLDAFAWHLKGTTGVTVLAELNGTGAFDVRGREFPATASAEAGVLTTDTMVVSGGAVTEHADHTLVGAFVSDSGSLEEQFILGLGTPTFHLTVKHGTTTTTCGNRAQGSHAMECYMPLSAPASGTFTFGIDGVEPFFADVVLSGADASLPP